LMIQWKMKEVGDRNRCQAPKTTKSRCRDLLVV
jgi:hypothetical protein